METTVPPQHSGQSCEEILDFFTRLATAYAAKGLRDLRAERLFKELRELGWKDPRRA